MTQDHYNGPNRHQLQSLQEYLIQLDQHCKLNALNIPSLPQKFNSTTLTKLLNLRRTASTQSFTQASDFSTIDIYYKALRENPFIFTHPKFLTYHSGAWWYYQLQTNPKLKQIPNALIAKYARVQPIAIENWRHSRTIPRMLFHLAKRNRTIRNLQQHARVIRRRCGGIQTMAELERRIDPIHFFFGTVLKTDKKLMTYRKDAFHFLALLQLVEARYHPREIEQHFKLRNFTRRLYSKQIPYLLRVAAQIPEASPQQGLVWVPTRTNWSKLPAQFIQAPRTITHYQEIPFVLNQLILALDRKQQSVIRKSVRFQQWVEQFGKINSVTDILEAFAYALIGVCLSDGCIAYYPDRAKFSSIYQLTLSKEYNWSQMFGERVTYYLTVLGFPMKMGKGTPPSHGNQSGKHVWHSVKSPFLTWVNQAVLGFQSSETHTDTPAQIDWLLTAPVFFLKRVIQGLFDGDGWAMPTSNEVGVFSEQNQRIILRLLRKVGIRAYKHGQTKVLISSKAAVNTAVKLPVFLASEGRQKRAKFLAMMNEGERLTGHKPSLQLRRRILELHEKGSSNNQIRVKVFNETGIKLSKSFISRIAKKGVDALKIDMVVVRAYLGLLQKRLISKKSNLQLVREIRAQTGFRGTMRNWLNSPIVPYDVKLYLSDNPDIDPTLLEAYSYLREFLSKKSLKMIFS